MVDSFSNDYIKFIRDRFADYLSEYETTIDWGDVKVILSRGYRIPCSMHMTLLKEMEAKGYIKILNKSHIKVEVVRKE